MRHTEWLCSLFPASGNSNGCRDISICQGCACAHHIPTSTHTRICSGMVVTLCSQLLLDTMFKGLGIDCTDHVCMEELGACALQSPKLHQSHGLMDISKVDQALQH